MMDKPGAAYSAVMKKPAAKPKVDHAAALSAVKAAMDEPDMAKKQAHMQQAHMALGGVEAKADVDDT